jgi:regulator of replication initiation timing
MLIGRRKYKMSEITLEVLAAEVAEIKTKVNEIYTSSPVQQAIIQANQQKLQNEQMAKQKEQQKIQQLQQERQMITQLQMEGYTKEEAVIYYSRMLKGEKPWLDPPGFEVDGITPTVKK